MLHGVITSSLCSQLAALLDSLFGEYVADYDRESLKVSVWKGKVSKQFSVVQKSGSPAVFQLNSLSLPESGQAAERRAQTQCI